MMINPQWLRSFVTLVEVGNFTRAAAALDLTQAAVSQHIARLEGETGPVLIRRPRAIELTPAGKALLAYAREIEQADQRLHARLSDGQAMHGVISLITPGSVGLVLYPLLLDLQQAHRELSIRHRFAPDAEIIASVLDTRFELGLSTVRPDDARLVTTPFLEEPLELVVPHDARVEQWDDLAALGFIDHPDGMAMAKRLLSSLFPGNPGVASLRSRGFSNQIALILEPVARGLGFTVLPRYARQAFNQPELIRVVQMRVEVRDTLWLLHRAEWPLTARSQTVLEALRRAVVAPPGTRS